MQTSEKEPTAPRPSSTKKHWPIIVGVTAGVVCLVLVSCVGALTHSDIKSQYQTTGVSVNAPLEIKLNQGLLSIPLDKISISPTAEGSWSLAQSLTGGDTLRFTPARPFVAGTTYTVVTKDVRRVSGIKVELPHMSFATEAAPGIDTISFGENQVVAADSTFTITLGAKNRGLRELELQTSPKVPLEPSAKDDQLFAWKPADILPQGKQVVFTLIDKKTNKTLLTRTVRVAAKPELQSRPAASYFGKHDVAKLSFKQPIDPASGTIVFSLAGRGEWQDDKTYVFTPAAVQPGTTYSYTLPKGLRSKEGGIVTKAQIYRFSTPGSVRVAAFSPYGQELSQKHQTVRVGFDQPVDKKSAEKRVTLSRGTVSTRHWEGNTLVLRANNFGVQQTVVVTVKAGVEPVFGLPGASTFTASFTTEIPVKKLNVPMYYQQYAQSCEAASVRMALAYKGAGSPSDWSILQRFGYDPRPMDKKKNLWDDPQQQFVGDVKGDQGKATGWGVYAEPVASAVRSYGRGASVRYGVSASFLAQNIYSGNPVVLWGIWGESAAQKSWKTPSGKKVTGPVPMHVRLVVGVKGKASNPIGFYINDPITGPTYWTTSYLLSNVQRAGAANQAVAIQ